ncbi:MAG: hypothetical protein E6H75_07610 [Betaproteobacteria bacterium]|nr:MAG: hypothetical protein E6H75_07610 [Betaproteobacteria bacterium]
MNRHSRFPDVRLPRRERGTMLIIALIVLVAMTLAGIATMRSVDTTVLTAGNIAVRQSSVNAADQGLQAGYLMLVTNAPNPAANVINEGMGLSMIGYYSSAPITEPKWSDPNVWKTTGNPRPPAQLNAGAPDAAGNVVSYFVERLCLVPNCKPGDTCGAQVNACGSTVSQASLNREGGDNFRAQDALFTSVPYVHYRITARAAGPRNSVAIVQILAR